MQSPRVLQDGESEYSGYVTGTRTDVQGSQKVILADAAFRYRKNLMNRLDGGIAITFPYLSTLSDESPACAAIPWWFADVKFQVIDDPIYVAIDLGGTLGLFPNVSHGDDGGAFIYSVQPALLVGFEEFYIGGKAFVFGADGEAIAFPMLIVGTSLGGLCVSTWKQIPPLNPTKIVAFRVLRALFLS